jgi:hypothetical protein
MKLKQTRLVTDNVQKLTSFYEKLTGATADVISSGYVEFQHSPCAGLAITSVATAQIYAEGVLASGANRALVPSSARLLKELSMSARSASSSQLVMTSFRSKARNVGFLLGAGRSHCRSDFRSQHFCDIYLRRVLTGFAARAVPIPKTWQADSADGFIGP